MERTKIVIADDHLIYVQALEAMFREHPSIEIVGTASNGNQALAAVRTHSPRVILLDYQMPGMDGREASEILLRDYPDVSILILSMHKDPRIVCPLRKMGVHGYLLKESTREEVEDAVKVLARGGEYFGAEIRKICAEWDGNRDQSSRFTSREREVLVCLAEGWDNPRIADELGVQVSTVDTYMKSLREKTGHSSARALVKYAIENLAWLEFLK